MRRFLPLQFLERAGARRQAAADRRPSPWTGVVVVVQLPRKSPSLHFRAYAENVCDEPVLHWVARRLSGATGRQAEIRVLADPSEEQRAIAALGSDIPHASVCLTSGLGELQDLTDLSQQRRASRFLLLDLSAALLPPLLLGRIRKVHAFRRADATYADRVPCANPPLIVEAWLVRRLAKVASSGADVRSLLSGIRRASELSHVRGIRVTCVRAAEDGEETRWPYSAALDSQTDIEVLAAVLGRADTADDADLLRSWTDVVQTHARPSPHNLAATRLRTGPSRAAARTPFALFVSAPSAFSGAEESLIVLAEGLRRMHGDRFRLAALVGQPGVFTDRLAAAGVEVVIACRDFAANSVENFLYSTDVLERLRPSLVHANSLAGVPFGCAAARAGIPFVQHVRMSSVLPLAGQLSSASAVIAVSAFTKQCLVRLGVNAAGVRVVHNGVPRDFMTSTSRASGQALRRECGIPEDAPVALMVARFDINKRHDVAVEAIARITQRHVHLLLAGDARKDVPVLENVRQHVSRLKLSSRVTFLGFRRDMPAVYAASDVLLLPSEDDPLPRTVLEGMASGLPVIASRSGGIPEQVSDQVSGILVRPGDADGFAAAVEQVLADGDLRARLVAAAARRVELEFSVDRYVEGVLSVYDQVLATVPGVTTVSRSG